MTLSQRMDVEYYLWLHGWNSYDVAWDEFCRMTMTGMRYLGMRHLHWCLVRGTYKEFLNWIKNSGYCEIQDHENTRTDQIGLLK